MTYDYNKPRRLNVVSLFLLVLVAGAGYAAYKFVPVYWQAREVDQALDELKLPAATFFRMRDDLRRAEADRIIARAYARLAEMGIEDHEEQPLQIWFAPDHSELHAKYRVDVRHPIIDKVTPMTMERQREIPKH
jgi:hypothetical protein